MADEMVELPLSLLLPPRNDREYRDPGVLDRMTASIETHGFLQPVRVIKESDKYRVGTGWTRVICGRRAGKTHVPCIVLDRPFEEADDLIEKIIENECQGDTSPLDRAKWDLRLLQLKGWSKAELALHTHQSRSQVSKDLAIFERLIEELKAKVYSGEMCPRAGYPLSRLSAEQQRDAWPKVAHMKAEAIEDYVNGVLGKKKRAMRPVRLKLPNGTVVIFPGTLSDTAITEDQEALRETNKKREKHGLPLSSLTGLLRGA